MSGTGKDLAGSISKIVIYLQTVFFSFFIIAANFNVVESNPALWGSVFAAILAFAGYLTFRAVRSYNRQKTLLKIDAQTRKTIRFLLTPAAVGFALMALGIYVASIIQTHQVTYADGSTFTWQEHAYLTEAFLLFLAGTALTILTAQLLERTIPKLTKQTKNPYPTHQEFQEKTAQYSATELAEALKRLSFAAQTKTYLFWTTNF